MTVIKLLKCDLNDQHGRFAQAQWAMAVALALISAALYLMEIRPASRDLEQVHKQFQLAQWELQQDQAQAGSLPKVEMEIARLKQRVERFDKQLPREPDLAPFIKDVYRISEESSLKKLDWHAVPTPKRTEEFAELPIRFSFEGDFQTGIVEFLRRTEDLQRLTRIQKLDIKAGDARDGRGKAELTMNIYYAEQ
jgi:Tfp pilus assembly protein PilO